MHWNCCEDLFSVSADRNGMAAPSFLVAAGACVILLRFAADSPKSHCDDSVRRVNGALAAHFSDSGSDAFPYISFKKVLQNRRFAALASRSGFGAANRCKLWSRRA